MRVSGLFCLICLGLIASICFLLTPITAGEHPWDEDQYSGDIDSTVADNTIIDPDIPEDGSGALLGTPFWWLDIIAEDGSSPNGTAEALKPNEGASETP